jgi:hypothetical protein
LDFKSFNYKIDYKNRERCIAGPKHPNKTTGPRYTFKKSHKTYMPKMTFPSYQKYKKYINK